MGLAKEAREHDWGKAARGTATATAVMAPRWRSREPDAMSGRSRAQPETKGPMVLVRQAPKRVPTPAEVMTLRLVKKGKADANVSPLTRA